MIARTVILFVIAIAAGAGARQQPPRDVARPTSGSASISGVVLVDGDPARPARRVRVTLREVAQRIPGQTTTTDDHGGFVFRGLSAGRFELQAFKNAYLRGSYGASRPERSGTPVVVQDGESVSGLTIAIVRGSVITGTVRDARGRPVPGADVRVLRLGSNGITGERTLGAPGTGSITMTDDRGEYRAYGLPPGRYFVLVPPPAPGGRSNDGIRQLTSEDVRQALHAARSTTSAVPGAAPPLPTASGVRLTFAPIFYPGVPDIAEATMILVAAGEERAGVDIATRLVPTATVTVSVTSPSGALPSSLMVSLVPAGPYMEMLAGAGVRGTAARQQADGRFVFTGVTPGTYTAKATIGRGRGAAPDGPTQWAAADVQVLGQDLSVALTLQNGVPVNGRVVFEGAQPTPAELESLSFMLVTPGSGGQIQSLGGGRVDKDGRFTFASVTPDTYRFVMTWNAAAAGDRWTIRASTANGREAFESPLRVSPGEPLEWTVTFTDTPTTLTGTFQGPDGRAATEYYILVFAADRAHWIPGSRRVRTTRPATDGSFTVKGLPPGEYFLAALPDLEPGEWNDAAFLEQLVQSSANVILRDGQTTTQNYWLGGE